MHLKATLTAVAALLPALSAAWEPPTYEGFNRVWSEQFRGSAGDKVNESTWNYITIINVNNELQKYTTDRRNVQISGGGTVQLVPWRDANGKWTSGRIETKNTFTPAKNKKTRMEANIRFGSNDVDRKKGMWPAFWLLGGAIRNGVDWPGCGEIDILETVNGKLEGHGTVHCDVEGGGACNTPIGIGSTTSLGDQGWHTWRVQFDRTPSSWRQETITWFKDGQQFHQVSGDRIGSESVWKSLCHSPMYFIMNVAVGGNWPGNPNDRTLGGYGSMMEVAYVAVYRST